MITATQRKSMDRIIRRGIAMMIESDFYLTATGRSSKCSRSSLREQKGCEGCSLALVYRVTQSLAELGKPHTAPPQNLQTTIMRSVGGLTTKTSTRTPRARAGSAPPNSKGSVVPYKPLFSDPRARLWLLAFAVERSLPLNLRPVAAGDDARSRCDSIARQPGVISTAQASSGGDQLQLRPHVVRDRDHHLPSSRMHPRLRR